MISGTLSTEARNNITNLISGRGVSDPTFFELMRRATPRSFDYCIPVTSKEASFPIVQQ